MSVSRPVVRLISLGAGVQSTTMALMAAHGEIGPMPDGAIFADTQAEPSAVYRHLNWLRSGNVLPFPVHVVSAGNLKEDLLVSRDSTGGRYVAIPAYLRHVLPAGTDVPVFDDVDGEMVQIGTRVLARDEVRDGMGRRQCTREYKIAPILKKQRELLGYRPRQRIPAGAVEVWIGISTDEAARMKPSGNDWSVNRWPLIEAGMSRQDCLQWLDRHGYPRPPKSACTFCPFHNNAEWRDLRDFDPEAWAEAVEVDAALRNGTSRYAADLRAQAYLHPQRVPLDQVDLSTAEDRGQLNLFINECTGICGT